MSDPRRPLRIGGFYFATSSGQGTKDEPYIVRVELDSAVQFDGTLDVGTVSVSNFPATQPVSGTVTLGAGSAAVGAVVANAGTGTDTRAVVGVVLAESGGGVLLGSAHPLPVSGALPVAGSAYAPSAYQNLGAATKANVKAAAGNVYSVFVTNTNAAVRYLQLHNKATAPAGGDAAQESWPVPAGTATVPGYLILDSPYFAPSAYFSAGIGFAISTTEGTFTDSAVAAEHTCRVRFV